MIKDNILQAVGDTPLVRLNRITQGLDREILVKVEGLNPSGSIKIRPALNMILDAEEKGLLKEGYTIVEFTSGNQGIGLSLVAAVKGYKCIIVMPDCMSKERINTMKAYGSEILLTPSTDNITDTFFIAKSKAEELAASNDKYFLAGQFANHANSEAHYNTTGVEIAQQLGEITPDAFVASIGTGGTITGTGRYLKEKFPNIKIFALEPSCAAILSGKMVSSHKQQGIGDGFIPDILDQDIYDEVLTVTDEEAYEVARKLASEEGLFVGISSGTNVAASIKAAKKLLKGSVIVTVLPDNGDRYLSVEGLFDI
ncbi:MAG: cysteine synthase A [Clostridia bacterium]